jgi:hypothetical protein
MKMKTAVIVGLVLGAILSLPLLGARLAESRHQAECRALGFDDAGCEWWREVTREIDAKKDRERRREQEIRDAVREVYRSYQR